VTLPSQLEEKRFDSTRTFDFYVPVAEEDSACVAPPLLSIAKDLHLQRHAVESALAIVKRRKRKWADSF
jgi:hypothetical protein